MEVLEVLLWQEYGQTVQVWPGEILWYHAAPKALLLVFQLIVPRLRSKR